MGIQHYRMLGLETGASVEEIKAAYRRLAMVCHPDHNAGSEAEAARRFREIDEAYKI